MNLRYLFIVFCLSGLWIHAQSIKWMTLGDALEAQRENPKKIIVDVYTDWCGPCKLMDKKTFQNLDVATYISKYYYAVKFNAEGNSIINFQGKVYENPGYRETKSARNSSHNFTRYLGVYGYPTIVFFDKNANPIAPITGYLTPKQIEIYLNLFKGEEYLKIKSQEDFKKFLDDFESKFEE